MCPSVAPPLPPAPFHPVFLLSPAFFTSRPTKPIFVIRGKRDNRKEKEWEEEESRENKGTKEYVPVGSICTLVLHDAVDARVVPIPPPHREGRHRYPHRSRPVPPSSSLYSAAKEIIVEEEDSKVERRTEDRGQTKEKKQKVTSCPTQLIVVLDGKKDNRKEEE